MEPGSFRFERFSFDPGDRQLRRDDGPVELNSRHLGDDAASPRFIETIPKHGYRFIAPVSWVEHDGEPPAGAARPRVSWRQCLLLGGAGAAGGGLAGVFGGLFYGLVVSQPLQPG